MTSTFHTRHHSQRPLTFLTRSLLSFFIVSCVLLESLQPATAQKGTRTYNIGFLGNTDPSNPNTQAGGGPALFAARLAVAQLNNRTDILPNTRLVLINNNTKTDAPTANLEAYDQIVNHGVVAIVGEYNSGVSIAASYPTRFFQVPMVSYGSTSPDFTTFHASTYSYFLRMCPSQNSESVLMAYLVANQGWSHVGLISTTDSAGLAGAQLFTQKAGSLGIQVTSAAFVASATLNDVYFAMSNVKASGATILVFIGAINDFQSIMKVCALGNGANQPPLGMYGPGYQWIGLHSYMYTTVYKNTTGGVVQYQKDFVQGLIGLQNFADVQSDVYKQYAAAWAATPAQADNPAVVPSNPASFTAPGNFAYDAVYFIARALDRMETEYGLDMNSASSVNKTRFLQVLKEVSFAGVTGPVSVDQNGDRSAPFDIENFQGDALVSIGTISETGNITLSKAPIQYMGGYKALDHVVRGTYVIPYSTRAPMLAFTIITIVMVLIALIALGILSDRPVLKAASPPFIASMLVGVCLLVASMFPRIVENYENDVAGCKADLFLTNYGYTLIVGSLLVKTYRVDSIFRMRQFQQTILTNVHLFGILGFLMVCQTGLLLGLIFGDPFYMTTDSYNSTSDYNYCSSDHQEIYQATIMAFRFFLLFVTAVYTFRIRDIPDQFNESKQLGMTVYNLMFLSVLLPIIDTALGRGKGTAVIAYGIAIFGIALVTSGIMLVPKFVILFVMQQTGKDQRQAGSTLETKNSFHSDELSHGVPDSNNKTTPSRHASIGMKPVNSNKTSQTPPTAGGSSPIPKPLPKTIVPVTRFSLKPGQSYLNVSTVNSATGEQGIVTSHSTTVNSPNDSLTVTVENLAQPSPSSTTTPAQPTSSPTASANAIDNSGSAGVIDETPVVHSNEVRIILVSALPRRCDTVIVSHSIALQSSR